jgi:hypothetical protein
MRVGYDQMVEPELFGCSVASSIWVEFEIWGMYLQSSEQQLRRCMIYQQQISPASPSSATLGYSSRVWINCVVFATIWELRNHNTLQQTRSPQRIIQRYRLLAYLLLPS